MMREVVEAARMEAHRATDTVFDRLLSQICGDANSEHVLILSAAANMGGPFSARELCAYLNALSDLDGGEQYQPQRMGKILGGLASSQAIHDGKKIEPVSRDNRGMIWSCVDGDNCNTDPVYPKSEISRIGSTIQTKAEK